MSSKPISDKVKKLMNIKRGDLLLAAGLLALGLIAAILLPLLLPAGDAVAVEINGEAAGIYPLNVDRVERIESEGGYNLLIIKDGRAFIDDADCRCGVCVAHAPISDEGETVICLPHKLAIRIVKEGK